MTKKEVREMGYPSVPNPRGEAIAMIWEDGVGLIFWDGKQFPWSGVKQ